MAIIMREFPAEKRGLALGFWSISAAASVSLGPMLGGYLVDRFDWGMIFNINVPIGLFSLFATWVIQREYRAQESRDFDWIGFVTMALFLSTLLVALSSGNAEWNTGGWTSDFILSFFAISIVSFTAFLITEFTVRHPLVNLRLLGRFSFGLTNAILFIFGLGMFGSTFLLPLYLQNSLGYTALQAGLFFLPMGLLQAASSPIAGILGDRLNPKVPIIIGIVFMAFSFFLNSRLSLFSEHAQIMMPLYIRALGMGMLFTPLSAMALSDIPRKEMAQASGLFNVIRQIGGSFGVATFGTLLVQRVAFHSATYGEALNPWSPAFKSIENGLKYFVQNTTGGTLADAALRSRFIIQSHVMTQAFVQAVDDDFLIAACATAFCILPVLILPNPKRGIKK
jgi:MFS transporter, DHA2 family, multidrug resistance protein